MPRLRTPSLKIRQNTEGNLTGTPVATTSTRRKRGRGRPAGKSKSTKKNSRKSRSVAPWEEGGEADIHYGYESMSDADDEEEEDEKHRITPVEDHWISDEELSEGEEIVKPEQDELLDATLFCPWVELDASEVPTLQLPTSSTDIPLHNDHILDMIEIYEILRSYGHTLRLSPFLFEDFCAAMTSPENSCLLSEIHLALIRICLKADEEEQIHYTAMDSNNAFNIMIYAMDSMNYAEVLRQYLESDRCRSRVPVEILNAINTPNYPFVDLSVRAVILTFLCYRFLDSIEFKKVVQAHGKINNEDACRACSKGGGDLLRCDNCEASFHSRCVVKSEETEEKKAKWRCDLCIKCQVRGVTDCLPLDNISHRHSLRMTPLGRDRHGRIYWHAVRRIIVQDESEHSELFYYSTAPQLYELTSRLDAHYLEFNLCKTICERMEGILEQMAVTLELSNDRRDLAISEVQKAGGKADEVPLLFFHMDNVNSMKYILREVQNRTPEEEAELTDETGYIAIPVRMEPLLGISEGKLDNTFWSGYYDEPHVLDWDPSLVPPTETLFRMGSVPNDGGYRQYTNQYALHEYAEPPAARKKILDKKKYMSTRFSLMDEGEGMFQWSIAKGKDMYGEERLQSKYVEWTMGKMSRKVPVEMMHRRWTEEEEKFRKDLALAADYKLLASCLLRLECAMRRTLFHAQFWNSLGYTSLMRTTVEDRELQSKELQKRKREEKELTSAEDYDHIVRVKYTRLPSKNISQGLWRQKDELYRLGGRYSLGGWIFVSNALVRDIRPEVERPPLGATEETEGEQGEPSVPVRKARRLHSLLERIVSWRTEEELVKQRKANCDCYSPSCRMGLGTSSVCEGSSDLQSCYAQSCSSSQPMDIVYASPSGKATARDVHRVPSVQDGVPGEDLPFPLLRPNTFKSRGAKKMSIFVINQIVLRKLARQGGRIPIYIPQFSLNAKSNFTVWNYPCQRPCFDLCWRWLVTKANSLHAVALQTKILWYCIKWAEFEPSEDDADDGRVIVHQADRDDLRRIIGHKEFKPLGTYERYLLEIESVLLEDQESAEEDNDNWDGKAYKKKIKRSSSRLKKSASKIVRKRLRREEWIDGIELKVSEIKQYWSAVASESASEKKEEGPVWSKSLIAPTPKAVKPKPRPPATPRLTTVPRFTSVATNRQAHRRISPYLGVPLTSQTIRSQNGQPLTLLTEKRKRQLQQHRKEDYIYGDFGYDDFEATKGPPVVDFRAVSSTGCVAKRPRPMLVTTNSLMTSSRRGMSPSRRTSHGYEYDGGMIRGGGRANVVPVGVGMRRVVAGPGSAAQQQGVEGDASSVSVSSGSRVIRVAAGGGNVRSGDEPPLITRFDSQGGSYGAPRTGPTRQVVYAQASGTPQRVGMQPAPIVVGGSAAKGKVLMIRRSDGSTQYLRPLGKEEGGVAPLNEQSVANGGATPATVVRPAMDEEQQQSHSRAMSDHASLLASSLGDEHQPGQGPVRRVVHPARARPITVLRNNDLTRSIRLNSDGQQILTPLNSTGGGTLRMTTRVPANYMEDPFMKRMQTEKGAGQVQQQGVYQQVRRPVQQAGRAVVHQRPDRPYFASEHPTEEYALVAEPGRPLSRQPVKVTHNYSSDRPVQRVLTSQGGAYVGSAQRGFQNKNDFQRRRQSAHMGPRRVTSYKEFCLKRGIVDNMRLPSRPYRFEFESNEDEERAIAEAIAREEEIMRREEETKKQTQKTDSNWQHPRIIDQFGQVSSSTMFSQLEKQPLNYSSNLMPHKDDSSDQKSIKQMLDSLITQVCRWDKQYGWYKSHMKRPRHRMELDRMRGRRLFSNQREVMLAEHVERLRKEINKRRTRLENLAEEQCGLPTPWRKARGRNRGSRRLAASSNAKAAAKQQPAPKPKILNPAEISLGGDSNYTEEKKEEGIKEDEELVEDTEREQMGQRKRGRAGDENELLTVGDWLPKRKGPALASRVGKRRNPMGDMSSTDEGSSTRSPRGKRGRSRRNRLTPPPEEEDEEGPSENMEDDEEPPSSPAPDSGDEEDEGDEDECGEDSLIQHPVPPGMDPHAMHCICQTAYNPYKFYLACDNCSRWFHGKCVNVSEIDAQQMLSWSCDDCANADRDAADGNGQSTADGMKSQLYCVCQQPYDEAQFYVGCDGCEGWFHPACVGITQEAAESMEEYLCPNCSADQTGYESAASNASSGNEQILSRADYLLVWRLLDVLSDHRMAWPFRQPVNTEEFPNYLEVVKKPIDLSTIQKKLEDLEYSKMKDFTQDVTQMFENARLFNEEGSSIFECANTLEKVFEHHLAEVRTEIEARLNQEIPKEQDCRQVDSSLDIDTDQLIDVNFDVDPSMYDQLL